MQRAGWTLIELLVAIALAVLVAGMSATVLYSLTAGAARSSMRAVREHTPRSVVERMVTELEAGVLPADDPDDDTVEPGLRLTTRRDPDGWSVDDMEFDAWVPDPDDPNQIMPFRIRYVLDSPVDGDGKRRLRRLVFPLRDPSVGGLEEAVEVSTVLPDVAGWRVDGLTADGWHGAWPAAEPRGGSNDPVAVRIVLEMLDAPPRSVTGMAWRAVAGVVP